jgi:hypothetical protein
METERTIQNRALSGAFADIKMLIAEYLKIYTRATPGNEPGESNSGQDSTDTEQTYLEAEEPETENEIGVGLYRKGAICYLIAAIQILYHIKEIRIRISSITNGVDEAIHLSDVIRRMNTYHYQFVDCTEPLHALNNQLGLSENEDIEETIRQIISLWNSSKNDEVSTINDQCFRILFNQEKRGLTTYRR